MTLRTIDESDRPLADRGRDCDAVDRIGGLP